MKEIRTVHQVFKTLTILKGIVAITELLLGIAVFTLSKRFISDAIIFFIKLGLAGPQNGFFAQYISQFGTSLSLGIKLFFSLYLVGHGIVNLSLVYGIIKKPSFAYPICLLISLGFLFYQIYSYFISYSLLLLLITLFDIIFMGLLFYEYHYHLKRYSFLGKLKLIAVAKVPQIIELEIPKILPLKMAE